MVRDSAADGPWLEGGASVTPTAHSRRRDTVGVAGLIFLWLAATAWARPLALPDEGRYVTVAWEMLRSGDWLTPTLGGLPFFHKPPLFYWITAGSLSLFGLNEWAARAAPILGAWLGAFGLYLFVRRWSGDRAARLTLLVLLLQPLFYVGGQFANLDMLVAGCISATILLFAHAALSIEHGLPHRNALLAAYATAALGVLSKGLIGAVIPALVILCWLATMQRWRVLRSLFSLPAAGVFLVLAAPWFIAMQANFADFLNYFFVVQQFKRFAGSGFNNVQPVWFYPAVLLLFSVPWLPWLYRSLRQRDLTDPGRGRLRLLMWLWLAMVVLFFSMPRSKLLGYVLPALPPLAFLVADGFLTLVAPSRGAKRLWWGGSVIGAVISVGAVVVFSVRPPHSTRELAWVLGTQRAPGEPVFMLNHFYYDVPFYARLDGPVRVVDDWANPEVQKADNWRKELADAGQFAPIRSASTLISAASLPAELCGAPVSWVIGARTAASEHPFLANAGAVFTQRNTSLWRVDRASPTTAGVLRCQNVEQTIPMAPAANDAVRLGALTEHRDRP